MKQTYAAWLREFEALENARLGYELIGEERNETLRQLHADGYSADRAFLLISTAASVEKFAPLFWVAVALMGLGICRVLYGLAVGESWFGGLIFAIVGAVFVLWMRKTVRSVANLAANPTPTHLKDVK